MKKALYLTLLWPGFIFAIGPIFQHKDPAIQREFKEVYQELETKLSTASFSYVVNCASVTCAGSTYNGANQLLQLNSSSLVPNERVDGSSITKQGNTFNGASQLIKTNSSSAIQFPGVNTQPSQPSFLAYNSAIDSNATGDNTTVTVDFDTEVYDQASNFASDTFTAPVSGKYLLSAFVSLRDAAAGNKCEIWIETSNRSYNDELWPTSQITLDVNVIADMDASDTALVKLNCSGGALVVDVAANGGSTTGNGMVTYFSGTLLN